MQATTPAHGVGKGIQFLMFTGGAAADAAARRLGPRASITRA
jgi:hypothetical protein